MMLNAAHLARIDLNLLVIFQLVLEEGHVARAAARLNLTPSAVSHGLARLRRLLHDPLFLRTPKGVVPTARALALREPVAGILSAAQDLMGSAAPFDAATSQRRFLIGAPDAVLASVTLPLLQCIQVEAPQIDLGLVHLMPTGAGAPWQEALKQIEQRAIDVALLPLAVVPARFHAQALYEEEFVVAMRQGHPFARDPSEARFAAARHLLVSAAADPRGFVDTLLAKRGRQRRVALTVPSFAMAPELLATTDLLAALPRRFVARHAARLGLVSVELPFKRQADSIQAVVTKAALRDAGLAWLLRLLTRLFEEAQGNTPGGRRRGPA